MYICRLMNFKINWEALGIGASLACAIHCAIMPLALSSLPLFGINLIHNIYIELLLLGVAFAIGIFSLWHGFKKHHHHLETIGIFSVGICLFVLHQFIKFPYSALVFIVPGVAAIITAHVLNHRFCTQANHCHADDCAH